MHIEKHIFETKKAKEYFLDKISYEICPKGLHDKIKNEIENLNIVDIRDYDDYLDGHIPFAIHVPFEQLCDHLEMFEKKKVNIIYSYNIYSKAQEKAAYYLADKDYPVCTLLGGFKGWEKSDFDIVKSNSENEI